MRKLVTPTRPAPVPEPPVSSGRERGIGEPRQFSIARGPFLRLLGRLHLTGSDGTPRVWLLVAIAWVPLCAGALLRVVRGDRSAPMLFDLSVHTRLLIGIPLLILAERILERRCRDAITQLHAGNFAEGASVDQIVDRAERLADSRLVEVVLFTLVLLGGQAVLWRLVDPTRLAAESSRVVALSFARCWYATVAWPLAQFLFLRWLWHWSIWTYVLVRLSRLPLAVIATHPDHAAGLGFLNGPIAGFSWFLLAVAATIASVWGTQILAGRASVQAFAPSFAALLILAVIVACGPLLLFAGILFRARSREITRFNVLALEYVRVVHRAWGETRPDTVQRLDLRDLEALYNLFGVHRDLMKVHLAPIGPRQITGIWGAAVIPMIPLIATEMPLHELLQYIGGVLLGGLST